MPAAAPTVSEIQDANRSPTANFEVVDIDDGVVATLARIRPEGFARQFRSKPQPADLRISVGDTLAINVIEESPGLFRFRPAAPGTAEEGGGGATSFLPVTVAGDGTVHVPFAGQIKAAGRTNDELRTEIERKLADKAINPQVQVSVVSGPSSGANSATVGGEVNRSAIIALRPAGSRLLDVIAEAGGSKFPAYETTVHLTRRGKEAGASLQDVIEEANQNVFVYPLDNIYLSHDPKTFSVLGASTKVGIYPFGSKHLDLAEAVAQGGGFVDGTADPSGVFLFRFENSETVKSMKQDEDLTNDPVPVIYRLNLRSGKGYFLARGFEIRDKDIILLANSDGAQLLKFITLLQDATSIVSNVRTVTLSSGNGITTTTVAPH